jgi:sugar/nucleoside kinase (ribokinase family)
VSVDLAVGTPAFLDLTFVGLEALPAPGEERFAGDLLRTPGGGAITAVAARRLGLSTALVAPLGNDLAGEFVRAEVEREGVIVAPVRTGRTPQTVVMPVGHERTMVTVDPGSRAGAADLAAYAPSAIAANLEQLELLPDEGRVYVTCGDDDARAFAGRPPRALRRASALFVDRADALVLTGDETPEAAAATLAERVETVMIGLGARGAVAYVDGERVQAPDFDAGPVVDITGGRDLLCAAYAWAQMRGAEPVLSLSWAQLHVQLSMRVPTATRGALSEADLLEEGRRRELDPPPGVVGRA